MFITADVIDDAVGEHAFTMYDETGGIEVAILDCVGFLRHFLHLFHRLRIDFSGVRSFTVNVGRHE